MKIRIIGYAGQGIKTMSLLLGEVMASRGSNIAISHDYGTNVRSGKIQAEVVISKKKIENPKIEEPDLVIIMHSFKDQELNFKEVITTKEIDFEKMAYEKLKNKRLGNMILLGLVLKRLKVDPKGLDLEPLLPKKYLEKNIEAINMGYRLEK